MSTRQSQTAVEREVQRQAKENRATIKLMGNGIEALQNVLREKTNEFNVQIKKKNEQIDTLMWLCDHKDEQVKALEAKLSESQGVIDDDLKRQYEETIRKKEERIKSQDEWIEYLNRWARERDQEIKDLKIHLSAYDSYFGDREGHAGTGEARIIPIH